MTAFGVLSFVEALRLTNFTSAINSAAGLTALCPTDLAFASSGSLTGDISALVNIITRHALNSSVYSTGFRDGDLIYSESGFPILVSVKNGATYLNDAKLIATNFITQNGAMHVLDRVGFHSSPQS